MEENFQILLDAILSPKLDIQNQLDKIKGLSVNVDSITLNKSATSQLKKQLQDQKISLNLDLGLNNNTNDIKRQAQTFAQNANKTISKALKNTNTNVELKPFADLTSSTINEMLKNARIELEKTQKDTNNLENVLASLRNQFKQFGQVSFTKQLLNQNNIIEKECNTLKELEVRIQKVDGELKTFRTFKLIPNESGNLMFSGNVIKGAERYVQHLNDIKNLTNKTGDELNKETERLKEQQKYYSRLTEATKERYRLESQISKAGKETTSELQRQLKNAKSRETYNRSQITKRGLTDNSLEWDYNRAKDQAVNRYNIQNATAIDRTQAKQQKAALDTLTKSYQNAVKAAQQYTKAVNTEGATDVTNVAQRASDSLKEYETLYKNFVDTYSGNTQLIQNWKETKQSIDDANQSQKEFNDTIAKAKANVDYQKNLSAAQNAVSSGSADASFTNIQSRYAKLERLGVVSDSVRDKFQQLNAVYNSLGSSSGHDLIQNWDQYQETLKSVTNEVRVLEKENNNLQKSMNLDSKKSSLISNIESYTQRNTKLTKELKVQFEALKTSIQNVADESQLPVLRNQLTQLKNTAKAQGLEGKSFIDELKTDIGKVTEWLGATTVIMGSLNQIRNMITTVQELDTALTNLRMVTGDTQEETQKLMESYSQMGDELSATTTDIAASANEWLRQGQSIENTNKLIQASVVLSKIGDLDSESSTKYLTSVMQGYQISADNMMDVVDKLSAVDMASATDAGGLAEALSEVSASAQLAGVSLDSLLGYVAAIGEVTQEDMGSVGTTLNAVFSRMGNIKLSRLKDYENDTGEDLSNVETVLRQQGISLRDETGEFRDFDDVLDETAKGWENYSSVAQRAIASAFAGTHHMNEFIILMRDYATAMDYATIAADSNGEAMDKYSAYQDSISGKMERFRNSFQTLSSSLINSGLVKFFVDLGTTGVNALTGIVNILDKIPGTDGGINLASGILGAVMSGRGMGYVLCRDTYICTNEYKAHENCDCIC